MTRIRDTFAVCTAVVLLAIGTRPCAGQGAFECPGGSTCWIAETGSYNDANNWEGGFVPDILLSENAAIVNGGTAFVDDTPIEPANLYLGRTAFNGIGSLEIRNGGKLFVGDGIIGGLVQVGRSQFDAATGVGHLTVLRGGELETETLTSGGDSSSSIVLGQAAGSGTAKVTILGTSTLGRNTRIVGPNVEFTTSFLELTTEHILTAEITGPDHSTISVTEDATLNGSSLHVQFNGYTPAFDDVWNILDAFFIDGQFGQLTADGLPAGAGVFVAYPDGGQGSLARLSVGTQLALSIDRRTGRTTVENRAAAESVDFDAYLIEGIDGARPFDPTQWTSIQDQGEAGWVESDATNTKLGESNATGSRVLGPESSIDLGTPYSFTPGAIGEEAPQVAFQYNLEGGGAIPGRVELTGPHNNVVLVVDPATGGAAIQNQSVFDVDVDGYLITSLSGSLDVEAWSSFQDSGQDDWVEANPSAVHLAELNLNSSLSLGADGAPIGIGSPFDFGADGLDHNSGKC